MKSKNRNEYYREYRAKNRLKLREYNRKYNKQWRRENGYLNEERHRVKYPHKAKARQLLNYAVRVGFIKRKTCEICGNKRAQGHHDNYRKPLEVRWLCSVHHTEHHRKLSTGIF